MQRQRQRYRGLSGSADPVLAINLLSSSLNSLVTLTRSGSATHIVSGQVVLASSNSPRISVGGGLVIEEGRTNYAFNSALVASSGGSITAGQTDPAGGSSAILFTEDTGASNHTVGTNSIANTAGEPRTISFFVKPGTVEYVQITAQLAVSSTNVYANFRLSGAGSITAKGYMASNCEITQLSNGWYRISMMYTPSSTASGQFFVNALQTGSETRGPVFTGSGRTFYVYGAQSEARPKVSSYIPTTTTAVARSADVATITTPVAGVIRYTFVDGSTQSVVCASSGSYQIPYG